MVHLAPTNVSRQMALAKSARGIGARITLDTSEYFAARDREGVLAVVPLVDIFLPSAAECALLFGDASPLEWANRLLELGVPAVVIKLGSAGALLAWDGGRMVRQIPIYPVATVDSTGAGDSFDGGFAAALARGAELTEAACLATAVASHCVTGFGPDALFDADTESLRANSARVLLTLQQQ